MIIKKKIRRKKTWCCGRLKQPSVLFAVCHPSLRSAVPDWGGAVVRSHPQVGHVTVLRHQHHSPDQMPGAHGRHLCHVNTDRLSDAGVWSFQFYSISCSKGNKDWYSFSVMWAISIALLHCFRNDRRNIPGINLPWALVFVCQCQNKRYFLFILEVGDPKDVVRKMIRNLFKLLTKIYPASKMFNYVMEGITSKNSKTRMGRCSEECCARLWEWGVSSCERLASKLDFCTLRLFD